jgi:putative ABC transport system ATP-binding protein
MIELKDVCKDYTLADETLRILHNITFTIKEKEFLGILGSSGSGKSTLMHMIGLLDKPSCGQILIEKKDVSTLSDEETSNLRNKFVGFVFQQFNLINKLTVLENVMLPALYSHSQPDFDPKKRALELLEKFGMSERADFFPNRISGGQQQRTAIARALIMNPKLVLADEPTGNLDSKTGEEILTLMENLNNEFGVTVVIVTHDKNIAKRTKKQVFIKDGKIVSKYL